MAEPDEAGTRESVVMQRVIRASPDALFDAFTRRERLERWWSLGEDIRTEITELDLRVGGRYRMLMHTPDGQVIELHGEYRRVERPSSLVFTWTAPCAGDDVLTTVVEIDFNPHADGTEITLTHSRFPTPEQARQHEHGWVMKFEHLQEFTHGG